MMIESINHGIRFAESRIKTGQFCRAIICILVVYLLRFLEITSRPLRSENKELRQPHGARAKCQTWRSSRRGDDRMRRRRRLFLSDDVFGGEDDQWDCDRMSVWRYSMLRLIPCALSACCAASSHDTSAAPIDSKFCGGDNSATTRTAHPIDSRIESRREARVTCFHLVMQGECSSRTTR